MAGTLPAELTSFVGRERVLADLTRRLQPPAAGCRLLTLTGPGGAGKTRLALRAASLLAVCFEDGAHFVPLAPLRDPRLVVPALAQTLSVGDTGGPAALERLITYLRDRQVLLVLDNFEQVLGAAVAIPELLAACARVRVIVTSRTALRVSGEREVVVEPLELPGPTRRAREAPDAGPSTAQIGDCESVRLFVDRAQAVKADFVLTDASAPAVAELCRRLDGLPLAIELAAARSRLLDPQAMLGHLEHRLQFLTGGARDLPARQQTLRNTLAWSYDLLEPAEQALFRTLAVFVGGCTLDALQAVVADGGDVLDGTDSLVAKSLARSVVVGPGEVRITLLETTREFGLAQLAWTGELAALQHRHAEHYLALAEAAEPALWGPAAGTWLARLEAEHDNLRAALEWSLGAGGAADRTIAPRLAGALARFWWTRGYFQEGLDWLARTLAATPERTAARMKVLYGAGWLAHFLRDSDTARTLLDESLCLARELDDAWAICWVLHVLGRVAYFEGDHAQAHALGEQSLACAERLGDPWLIAWALHLLGLAAHVAGDYARANRLYERSLAIRCELGHREQIGVLYQLMGMVAYRQGDARRARVLYEQYLAVGQELGSTFHLSNALGLFGNLAAGQGQLERAARLLGATAVFNEVTRTRSIPLTEAFVAEAVAVARGALGAAAFAAAEAAGRALSSDEAIAEARAVEVAPPAGPGRAVSAAGLAGPASPLTGREQEVAALVARGLTNRQIAAELVISERTVEAHITHVLDKLAFATRTQIGIWAATQARTPTG